MPAEYILTTNAPDDIVIEGENLKAFSEVLPGRLRENKFTLAFTKENATRLRRLLTGRSVQISKKDRVTLAFLADQYDERKPDDYYLWNLSLTDAMTTKIEGKFGRIKTEWDLLHYLPLRFIDKSNPQQIDELELGGWGVIVGQIQNKVEYDWRRELIKIVVEDVSGKRVSTTFFGKQQKWREFKFKQGDEVVLYGNYSEYVNKQGTRFPQISNGSLDKLTDVQGSLPMIPVYPQKSGDKTRQLQKAIYDLLERIVWIDDPVPAAIIERYNLLTRDEAYRKLHFPLNREDADRARERLAFDEFVRLQVFFHQQRSTLEHMEGKPKTDPTLRDMFIDSLPFEFTGAQKRVVQEINADLAAETPMYRLLQGDVGSGKTEISSAAALTAVGSGYQVAFMAPTDILASQLYDRMIRDITKAGLIDTVSVRLLTGKPGAKEKRVLLAGLADGSIDIVVGTHAVIQKTVKFKDLGLVIIDEQHKFGAEQRSVLRENNKEGGVPDMLMMSATPIPRTTAQVIYGDMTVSVIDELPPGRTPIETYWHKDPEEAWERMIAEIADGHQAYVVASLVADSESESMADVESATSTYEDLRLQFPDYQIGLLHGKLAPAEKEAVIDAFYRGETQILVATTVVEVGVNVPNATVMTILNANRFGIASLHQIRGRVGRGNAKSYCYLIGEVTNAEAEERLQAMVASTDGFWLAEKDLELRGEGSLLGLRQSGLSDNFAANLREHRPILDRAKRVAGQAAKSPRLRAEVDYLYEGITIAS